MTNQNTLPKKPRIDNLITIQAMSENQGKAMRAYKEGNNLIMTGSAGAGKTFLAMQMGFEDVLMRETPYDSITIVRSAVPTRDMGFMPGNQDEKEDLFTAPYKAIVADLFNSSSDDAWNKVINSHLLNFISTSYVRGITLKDTVVIIDEFQNMSYHELRSVITRLGPNTRLVLSGDTAQIDLVGREKDAAQRSIKRTLDIFGHIKNTEIVEFTQADCVRSGLVREFLMTEELYDNGKLDDQKSPF